MTMKHFDTDFFSEIIAGMKMACGSLEVQQLLTAATQIYLASESNSAVKEGSWKTIGVNNESYKCRKIVECPFCGTKRGVFMGDTIDYCAGCGAKLK